MKKDDDNKDVAAASSTEDGETTPAPYEVALGAAATPDLPSGSWFTGCKVQNLTGVIN